MCNHFQSPSTWTRFKPAEELRAPPHPAALHTPQRRRRAGPSRHTVGAHRGAAPQGKPALPFPRYSPPPRSTARPVRPASIPALRRGAARPRRLPAPPARYARPRLPRGLEEPPLLPGGGGEEGPAPSLRGLAPAAPSALPSPQRAPPRTRRAFTFLFF